jgi:hypothetical protein
VTLTDGDVAVLARQAVDLFDPTLAVNIVPSDPVDPYRWGQRSWLVVAGPGSVEIGEGEDGAEVLARILDQLSEYGSEDERHWGRAFPACPGHPHPARIEVDGPDVVLRCPDTEDAVGRIRPDAP